MNRQPGRWEHFAHEADVGVRGIGADLRSAFEQAALALTAVVTDPAALAALHYSRECIAPTGALTPVKPGFAGARLNTRSTAARR